MSYIDHILIIKLLYHRISLFEYVLYMTIQVIKIEEFVYPERLTILNPSRTFL